VSQLGVRAAQHVHVGGAGVEPHVERVEHFLVAIGFLTKEFAGIEPEPGVDSLALDAPGDFLDELRRSGVRFARGLVDEEGDRHAPVALARDAPVGAIGDHGMQPCLAPGGVETGSVHAAQGFVAQGLAVGQGAAGNRVHGDEPLAGGAVDRRTLVAPAVGVAVADRAWAKSDPTSSSLATIFGFASQIESPPKKGSAGS